MAMRRASAQVGPPEEAPEELVFLSSSRLPLGAGDAKDPTQEGPRKVENQPSGWTTIGSDA
jgi:hypothetical protein